MQQQCVILGRVVPRHLSGGDGDDVLRLWKRTAQRGSAGYAAPQSPIQRICFSMRLCRNGDLNLPSRNTGSISGSRRSVCNFAANFEDWSKSELPRMP